MKAKETFQWSKGEADIILSSEDGEERRGLEMLRREELHDLCEVDDETEARKENDFQISVLGDWVSLHMKENILWQITCFRSI